VARPFTVDVLNNPVSGQLQLKIGAPATEAVAYTIADATGRTVRKGSLQLAKGENKISVDVGGLPVGLYFLTLQGKGGKVSKRFVRE
jgi:hypothetical protein